MTKDTTVKIAWTGWRINRLPAIRITGTDRQHSRTKSIIMENRNKHTDTIVIPQSHFLVQIEVNHTIQMTLLLSL